MKKAVVLVLAFSVAAICDDLVMKPIYKYRYETEDVMKTAETSIPVHGYHVVEGGYYPAEAIGGGYGGGYEGGYKEGYGGGYKSGFGGGIGGGGGYIGGGGGYGGKFIPGPIVGGYGPIGHVGGGFGGGGIGLGGIGGGYGKLGYGGVGLGGGIGHIGPIGGGGLGIGHHGYGGEEVEKSQFSEGKKNLEDGRFEKAYGKKGGEFNQGGGGYSKDAVAAKDVKGESGYYSNAEGGKKVYEDGKQYHGGQHFDKEGMMFDFIYLF